MRQSDEVMTCKLRSLLDQLLLKLSKDIVD